MTDVRADAAWVDAIHAVAGVGSRRIGIMIECRIADGGDLDLADTMGSTMAMSCAESGLDEALAALVAAGADVRRRTHGQDWTALHGAARNGHIGACRILLDAGADVRAVTGAGHAPIHLTGRSTTPQILKLLLRHGADAAAADRGGWTPITHVADAGYAGAPERAAASIRILAAAGCPVASTDAHIAMATAAGDDVRPAMAAALFAAGAGIAGIRDEGGGAAERIARRSLAFGPGSRAAIAGWAWRMEWGDPAMPAGDPPRIRRRDRAWAADCAAARPDAPWAMTMLAACGAA